MKDKCMSEVKRYEKKNEKEHKQMKKEAHMMKQHLREHASDMNAHKRKK